VPEVLPVLEDPPRPDLPVQPPGLSLEEALRQAAGLATPGAGPTAPQEPAAPAASPDAPQEPLAPTPGAGPAVPQAPAAPATSPDAPQEPLAPTLGGGPAAPQAPAAPASTAPVGTVQAAGPSLLPPGEKTSEPGFWARALRGLRLLENHLLSVIGKGDPVLDLEPELARINGLEEQVRKLSDAELRAKTAEFKARLSAGESLDDIRPEAFAVAREAARRVTGMRPYDVQILGGLAMGNNMIAEMKTGEGKTLTEVMPVYLNALAGKGVHVVTVNETLAARDHAWMGPVFEFLGLTTGLVLEKDPPEKKRAAYNADVTYVTNTTLGFDYLRDQTARRPEDRVQQRPPFAALIDEVDEILIDEARTPLIISSLGPPAESEYRTFAQAVSRLEPGKDFQADRKKHQAWLTEEGLAKVEKMLGVDDLYDEANIHRVPYLVKAVQARALYTRDRDYVVENGRVQIVDEFTGRILDGRRYNDGLHQALEAKEGVPIEPEQRTLAAITYPFLFRRYPRLAGMSGTAKTEESEFREMYGLPVAVIPTHKKMIREDAPDVVFRTLEEKFQAVVDDVERRFREGQPVLVGTRSIQVNEYLSALLAQRGIPHQVLSAKSVKDNTAEENAIIAEAGRSGMVTIATNMAGRGVDIKPDKVNYKKVAILASERAAEGKPVVVDLETAEEADNLKAWLDMGGVPTEVVASGADAPPPGTVRIRVGRDLPPPPAGAVHYQGSAFPTGGLYVIGTERHESRRIDNQLIGRSGRQGSPGGSRFYMSLEDDLLRHFGGPRLSGVLDRLGVPPGQGISDPMVDRLIRKAQEQIEGMHFSVRRDTIKYDQVLEKHREIFYGDRRQMVDGTSVREQVLDWGAELLSQKVAEELPRGKATPEGVEEAVARAAAKLRLPFSLRPDGPVKAEQIEGLIRDRLEQHYQEAEQRYGPETLHSFERELVLSVMDEAWMNHLEAMDEMRNGIGLVAYGEKDPWLAYQERAHELFTDMVKEVKEQVAGEFFSQVLSSLAQAPARAS
jgi:preprotein translocase subunit SecA